MPSRFAACVLDTGPRRALRAIRQRVHGRSRDRSARPFRRRAPALRSAFSARARGRSASTCRHRSDQVGRTPLSTGRRDRYPRWPHRAELLRQGVRLDGVPCAHSTTLAVLVINLSVMGWIFPPVLSSSITECWGRRSEGPHVAISSRRYRSAAPSVAAPESRGVAGTAVTIASN